MAAPSEDNSFVPTIDWQERLPLECQNMLAEGDFFILNYFRSNRKLVITKTRNLKYFACGGFSISTLRAPKQRL